MSAAQDLLQTGVLREKEKKRLRNLLKGEEWRKCASEADDVEECSRTPSWIPFKTWQCRRELRAYWQCEKSLKRSTWRAERERELLAAERDARQSERSAYAVDAASLMDGKPLPPRASRAEREAEDRRLRSMFDLEVLKRQNSAVADYNPTDPLGHVSLQYVRATQREARAAGRTGFAGAKTAGSWARTEAEALEARGDAQLPERRGVFTIVPKERM